LLKLREQVCAQVYIIICIVFTEVIVHLNCIVLEFFSIGSWQQQLLFKMV